MQYRPVGAARLLRDNLLIYGLGGLIVPFIGIKMIDMILVGAAFGVRRTSMPERTLSALSAETLTVEGMQPGQV